jgi:hypothetical protein
MQPCTVTLRNYRKNNELFLNRLSIRPLVDRENNVIYYLGVQYDVTNEVKAREEIDKLYLRLIEKRAVRRNSTRMKRRRRRPDRSVPQLLESQKIRRIGHGQPWSALHQPDGVSP